MIGSGSVVRFIAVALFFVAAGVACAQDDLPSGVDAVPERAAPAADGDVVQPREEPSLFSLPLLIACGLLWIYLLIIRPQSKQKAERADMMAKLKTNADVVTIGGIHGTVTKVDEERQTVTIKVDQNARLTVNRDAVREVLTPDTGDAKDKPTTKG